MLFHAAGPNDDPENTRGDFVSLSPMSEKQHKLARCELSSDKNWVPFLLKRISWHSLGLSHLTQKKQRKNITSIEIMS